MKITISKSQWQEIGKKAGWTKNPPLTDIVDDAKYIATSIDVLWQEYQMGMTEDAMSNIRDIIAICDKLKNELTQLMEKFGVDKNR